MTFEIRRARPPDAGRLARFLAELSSAGDARFFHPHSLTDESAQAVTSHEGMDLYYLAVDDDVVAYGMLRGWDEGYEVPSLGLAVHPRYRGVGLGSLMASFLVAAARLRRAPAVRLRVYPDNVEAFRLYRRLGFEFAPEQGGQFLGRLEL